MLIRKPVKARTGVARRAARLAVELLEFREVPASFRWTGGSAIDDQWSRPGNWVNTANQQPGVPGPTDVALLDGTGATGQRDVDVDIGNWGLPPAPDGLPTGQVGTLTVTAGYTGTLKLHPGYFQVNDKLTVAGGKFRGTSPTVLSERLMVVGAGNTLTGGEFDGIVVSKEGTATRTSTTTINGSISLTNDTILQVARFSELNWQTGAISTTGSAQVQNYAVLRINSPGLLSDNTSGSNTQRLVNETGGDLTFYSTTNIYGKFINKGLAKVESTANTRFYGKALQLDGTTEFLSGDITLVNTGQKYEAQKGAVTGTGTVRGNLELGTSANEVVILSPGPQTGVNKIGKITITSDLKIISSNAKINIDFSIGGSIDIVDVSGTAQLAGTLTIVAERDANGKPYQAARNTEIDFLKAGGFVGSFGAETDPKTWGSWSDPGGAGANVWKLKKSATRYSLLADAFGGS